MAITAITTLLKVNIYLVVFYICTAPVSTWFTYFHVLPPILAQFLININIKR